MRKVMVVEDEKDLGDMLMRFLRRSGYEPVYCEDGAQAWSLLQKGEPVDIIVTDVNMPEMDGLELSQRVRSHPKLRTLPIIMLTVKTQVPDQIEGYETGADDYIAKPFDFPVLLARIRALERRTLGAAK
jgi:DNA-binding response OmpR family regulator